MFRPVDPDRPLADSMAGDVYGCDREEHGRGNVLTIAAQYPTRLQKIQRLLFLSPRPLADPGWKNVPGCYQWRG